MAAYIWNNGKIYKNGYKFQERNVMTETCNIHGAVIYKVLFI